jgi:NTE family protein
VTISFRWTKTDAFAFPGNSPNDHSFSFTSPPPYYHWHVSTALVLSAGGMFGAWEVGVWKALCNRFQPDCIVGASAGAWNGWLIASGCGADELAASWLNPSNAPVMAHARGLRDKARELFARFHPRIPFGLAVTEVPRLRQRLVRDSEISWQHLAATSSIPLFFPPVRIGGARYVDGGLLGALPLWAAREMGATRAIAVNALGGAASPGIRALGALRFLGRPLAKPFPKDLEILRINPSEPLGSLRDAVRWSPANILRWIAQGERDANRAATSITM